MIFVFYGIGGIIFFLINIWIKDYKKIFLIEIVINFVFGFGLLFLPESPFYLNKKGKMKRLFLSLVYILKINNKGDQETVRQKSEQLSSILFNNNNWEGVMKKTSHIVIESIKDIGKRKNCFKRAIGWILNSFTDIGLTWLSGFRILLFTLLLSNIYLSQGLLLLVPRKIGIDNIYLNGFLLTTSEILGFLIISLKGDVIQRRKLNLIFVISIFIIVAVLLSLHLINIDKTVSGLIIATVFGIILKLFVAASFALVYTYAAELFPTRIRGLATGMAIFVGRLVVGLAPVFEVFAEDHDINPLITTIFGAVIALPCVLLLPETLYKELDN